MYISAGIDYSISGPALCIGNGSFEECKLFTMTKESKDSDHLRTFSNITVEELPIDYETDITRFETIAMFFINKLIEYNIKSVNLEGYAFAASGRVFTIAEHTGILKYLLHKNHIEYNILSPGTIKKFASGKGNANKIIMNTAFEEQTKIKLVPKENKIGKSPYSDLIDAFFIARCT